jgi:predicted ATPase/DNA-binding winged helix-turn-helix (wHTH) protein
MIPGRAATRFEPDQDQGASKAGGRGLVFECGEWQVDLADRELRVRDVLVPIGERAFEIVEVLVDAGGALVTKDQLMKRVWPGAIVEENTLQVHISAVRKAFGPDRGMLKTVSGRGYRLLGNWRQRDQAEASGSGVPQRPARLFASKLPAAPVAELIGRADAKKALGDVLSAYRIVTLTGPGGIGKTRLALAIAHDLASRFDGDAWFVELASLSDPHLIPTAVAAALGLKLGGEISPASVAQAIGGRRLMLVLDNCEHLVDSVAHFVETLIRSCARVTVLATSREVLRVDGEYVHRVPPLDVPDHENGTGDVLGHSAVQLFVIRTRALHSGFSPQEEELTAVVSVCRRLDGIPLAIEFAAARVATLGLKQVAARLDDRFTLLAGGRRTALPRHQTLRAALDWSYELLPEPEQRLLRRLSIFPAGFTLEAAAAVAGASENNISATVTDIAALVGKSLVTLDSSAPEGRWRLLETTRAYAAEKLADCGEAEWAARRHAEYFRDLAVSAVSALQPAPTADHMTLLGREIDNVRAALDWAFSPLGEASTGVILTAGYAAVWIGVSLIAECRERVERALASLGDSPDLSEHSRLMLRMSLGAALYHCTGTVERTGLVLAESLHAAELQADEDIQLRALWAMWSFRYNSGQMRAAQPLAERFAVLAARTGRTAEGFVGDRLLGTTLHHIGRHSEARRHLERVRDLYVAPTDHRHAMWFHYDQRVLARSILSRVLWMQGFPDQARDNASACVEAARSVDHKLTLCYALNMAACPIAILTGDLDRAQRTLVELTNIVNSHSVAFWQALTNCVIGHVMVRQGRFADGAAILKDALTACDGLGGTTWYPEFQGALAEGLAGSGRPADALATIDRALARVDSDGEHWCTAELLRLKGEFMLHPEVGRPDEAEGRFVQALEVARQQGALSWELRAAMSLARLRMTQDRPAEARQFLAPVYAQFSEGFATLDLRAAYAMLVAGARE